MRIVTASAVFLVAASGCAQSYSGTSPRSPSEINRIASEPPRIAAPLDVPAVESAPEPSAARPRIRDVVTLGHAGAEPTYAAAGSPARAAAQVVTNVTIVNQQPGFSGYWGGGGSGYRSFGYGSYGGYRSFSGSTSSSSWNANPRSSAGVPLQVGGDWRPPADYGPRPMR